MHRPPAVSHNVKRSQRHGALLLGIWLAAMLPLCYFYAFQQAPLQSAVLAAVWLVTGGVCMHTWRACATGLLQWDGDHWHWIQDGEGLACQVRMAWDCQYLVLIRLTAAQAPSRWLWLESGASLLQWNALRRALVSANAGFTEPSPIDGLEGKR
jgi:hypothetical protein